MHDLKTIYNKVKRSLRTVTKEYFDNQGNSRYYPHLPKLSDLEIISLAITAECLQIDSENLLWSKLKKDYSTLFKHLPHRTTFNRGRRKLSELILQCTNLLSDHIYALHNPMILL